MTVANAFFCIVAIFLGYAGFLRLAHRHREKKRAMAIYAERTKPFHALSENDTGAVDEPADSVPKWFDSGANSLGYMRRR